MNYNLGCRFIVLGDTLLVFVIISVWAWEGALPEEKKSQGINNGGGARRTIRRSKGPRRSLGGTKNGVNHFNGPKSWSGIMTRQDRPTEKDGGRVTRI